MNSSPTRKRDSDSIGLSIIGEDLSIAGNVNSEGKIHLDGRVQGDIHCLALSLGEKGELTGNVVADDVQVRGRLFGSSRARRVTPQSGSHVEANLFHTCLAIEQSSHFEGESHPSKDPSLTNQIDSEAASQGGSVPMQPSETDARGGFIKSLPEISRSSMNVSAVEE